MKTLKIVQQPLLAHQQLCQQQYSQMLLWLAVVVSAILLVFYLNAEVMPLGNVPIEFIFMAIIPAAPLLFIVLLKSVSFIKTKGQLTAYLAMREKLQHTFKELSANNIQQALSEAGLAANTNHLIAKLLEHYQPLLKQRMLMLLKKHLQRALNLEFCRFELSCNKKIDEIAKQVPLVKAKDEIESSLVFLAKRRQEMTEQWDAAYEAFSWWNKIKYADGPDFADIDKAIKELEILQYRLSVKHDKDFIKLDKHFKQLKQQAIARMAEAKISAEQFIQDGRYQDDFNAPLLNKALWFSAMSVPVSIWTDVDSAMNVYVALRGVNGNFAEMTDAEIWFESLLMPAESLAGLTALTKGAYFEQLVAADTGGQLHEHFNNPDTDIVIDGVAFQLKATGSESYIASVDETIPVMATSEVAATTGVIDSGYSNEELSHTVDSALGGTIVDLGDSTADAILAGLGGLGFFATIQGINHASTKYENGGDGVEAMFEGAGVAIEGTARALVGAAEMGYKVLASRPSRFIGRTLIKGLKKLDDKMMEAADKK
ncbi:MAG: hypothetical protein ACJAS1_001929 [Oleiphilaceae bacterium]|jgi:hypothetical protein